MAAINPNPVCSTCLYASWREKTETPSLNMGIAFSKCEDKKIAIMFCADCGTIFSTQIISQIVEKPLIELPIGGMRQ